MGTDSKGVACCLCRGEVDSPSGWCPNCNTYPVNIHPIRYCQRGHKVDPEGFCWGCDDWVLTRLDPQPGEWIDTGRVSKRLGTVPEVKAMIAELIAKLEAAQIKAQPKDRDKAKEKQAMFDAIRADNQRKEPRTSDRRAAGGGSDPSPATSDDVPF